MNGSLLYAEVIGTIAVSGDVDTEFFNMRCSMTRNMVEGFWIVKIAMQFG